MRRAARTDGNQRAGNDHLESIGWSICVLSAHGRGVPDSLVARYGFTALVEWKDGAKPPSARKLTPDQERFHADWQGVIITALSPEDAETKLNAALIRSGAAKREDLA